ncbi:hypothetical protein LSL4_gp157c [Pseudomonas phage LSL4]|nr:hypothetical protein LSL4_gp157c [Pseudomonas phage LSL4]
MIADIITSLLLAHHEAVEALLFVDTGVPNFSCMMVTDFTGVTNLSQHVANTVAVRETGRSNPNPFAQGQDFIPESSNLVQEGEKGLGVGCCAKLSVSFILVQVGVETFVSDHCLSALCINYREEVRPCCVIPFLPHGMPLPRSCRLSQPPQLCVIGHNLVSVGGVKGPTNTPTRSLDVSKGCQQIICQFSCFSGLVLRYSGNHQ